MNSSITVNLKDSQQMIFNCAQCQNFSCDHPKKLQRHLRSCNSKHEVENTKDVDSDIVPSIKQYRPVHSDYVTDERLKELQLYIHKELEFVYCAVCQVGIIWETLHFHMQRSHGHSIVVAELLGLFQKLMSSTRKPINNLNDERITVYYEVIMEPISGIEVQSGFKCLIDDCNYCCGTKGSLKNHARKEHPKQKKNFEGCFIQSLFNHPKAYFQVFHSKFFQFLTFF